MPMRVSSPACAQTMGSAPRLIGVSVTGACAVGLWLIWRSLVGLCRGAGERGMRQSLARGQCWCMWPNSRSGGCGVVEVIVPCPGSLHLAGLGRFRRLGSGCQTRGSLERERSRILLHTRSRLLGARRSASLGDYIHLSVAASTLVTSPQVSPGSHRLPTANMATRKSAAASSSGEMPKALHPGPAFACSDGGAQAQAGLSVDETSRIFLDRIAERCWRVTDVVTLEHHDLDDGEWGMVQDFESGSVAFFRDDLGSDDEGAQSVLTTDSFMKRSLYSMDGSGELFIVNNSVAPPTTVSLDAKRSNFEGGEVKLKLGLAKALSAVGAFMMAWPRGGGCRIFWNLNDLYKALSLTVWRGIASKWIWNGVDKWRAYLQGLGFKDHFIASTSSHNKGSDPFWLRCLPQPSCSTVALVELLARFAFLGREKGGMSDEDGRGAAREVLGGLLGMMQGLTAPETLEVVASPTWQCMWPRPQSIDGSRFAIRFLPNGILEMPAW